MATNLTNTVLGIFVGFLIDRFGGAVLSAVLAFLHLAGAVIQATATIPGIDDNSLFIAGQVITALGDGSIDTAQHKVLTTYLAPGKGLAVSIGVIWSLANVGQFLGQHVANKIANRTHSYSWTVWISVISSFFSLLTALGVVVVERFLQLWYHADEVKRMSGLESRAIFHWRAIGKMPHTFWLVVCFSAFQNTGMQAFVFTTTEYVQQRLQQAALVTGWVSSLFLLLPVGLVPLQGIFVDFFGHRITLLFISAILLSVSVLLLQFSPIAEGLLPAYLFYALAECFTGAPQAELVRNVIPDPYFYGLTSAIKKSITQASAAILIGITSIHGPSSHVDPRAFGFGVWLCSYAIVSVCIASVLLIACYTIWGHVRLPAARLAQVR